jgi:hypothetical protein
MLGAREGSVMGTSAVAQLGAVEASGLSTTVPRRDVERAIKAKGGPPELILDVTRSGDGETRSVAVQWTKADLEELLRQSTGDTVMLTFEGEDLLRAFDDPDVEPHGLREAILVTVAAGSLAGAGAAAAPAAMAPDTDPTGRYTVEATAPEPAAMVPDTDPTGRYTVEATTPQPAAMVPDTDPTGRYTVDPAAQPAGPGSVEYGVPRAMPADYATPTADTGGGISIEAPSPTTIGLIAGALGLAITGAAFAFDRRRRLRPQT